MVSAPTRPAAGRRQPGAVGCVLTDATSSGPQASTEAGTVSNLVTDTTSSAGSSVEGLTPAQQLNAIEATGETGTVSNLVTDATSSGPQASTEAASTGGGGQSFIDSRGGEAALAGGLMLLILGAGFVGSRQRAGPSRPSRVAREGAGGASGFPQTFPVADRCETVTHDEHSEKDVGTSAGSAGSCRTGEGLEDGG